MILNILKRVMVPQNCVFLLWLLALVYVITGPVWVEDKEFANTEYYTQSMQNLEGSELLLGSGELYVGYGESEIAVEAGQPIMGYTDRKPLASEGSIDKLYAKAITVKAGGAEVTIVGADVMLLMGRIIADICYETGLKQDELYFTATHTHSGVGGWFEHPFFELFYGKYSPKYYEALKNSLISAIIASRKNLVKARVQYLKTDAHEWLENRIYKEHPEDLKGGAHGVNPYLTGLSFVDAADSARVIAVLVAYAAHATVVRKDVHKFAADYPGAVCRELKRLTGAQGILFAAGSVGDARSIFLHQEGAEKLGLLLAERLAPVFAATPAESVNSISSLYLPIAMPRARLALLGSHSGVLPVLASVLFDNPVHISYLRIGKYALFGMPVDIAGELTTELQENEDILVTSFNGSWKGYATKADTYANRDTYATREMGLGGAQAGEFLMDVAAQILRKDTEVKQGRIEEE